MNFSEWYRNRLNEGKTDEEVCPKCGKDVEDCNYDKETDSCDERPVDEGCDCEDDDEEVCPKCGKDADHCTCDDDDDEDEKDEKLEESAQAKFELITSIIKAIGSSDLAMLKRVNSILTKAEKD